MLLKVLQKITHELHEPEKREKPNPKEKKTTKSQCGTPSTAGERRAGAPGGCAALRGGLWRKVSLSLRKQDCKKELEKVEKITC